MASDEPKVIIKEKLKLRKFASQADYDANKPYETKETEFEEREVNKTEFQDLSHLLENKQPEKKEP